MFIRRPLRVIDDDGNMVTFPETYRCGVIDTVDGLIEFFKLPLVHGAESALAAFADVRGVGS